MLAAATVDFNGHVTANAPASNGPQTYTLPALRSKQGLIDADNFLTQLSANVYEQSNGQGRQQYYDNQSPHTPATQPSPQHDGAPTAAMGNGHQNGNSALTPPNSNYTTSQSPNTHHTTPTVSPQTSAAYPTLPAVSNDNGSNGYAAPVSSAPASSLGTNFESSEARRYTVPVLRRAQEVSEMSLEDHKPEISNSMIDPSLGELTNDTPAVDKQCSARNLELINNFHNYIKELLAQEEERERTGQNLVNDEHHQDGQNGEGHDQHMGDPNQDQAAQNKQDEDNADAQALYPILKAVAAC